MILQDDAPKVKHTMHTFKLDAVTMRYQKITVCRYLLFVCLRQIPTLNLHERIHNHIPMSVTLGDNCSVQFADHQPLLINRLYNCFLITQLYCSNLYTRAKRRSRFLIPVHTAEYMEI